MQEADEAAPMSRPVIMIRLLQGIQDEAGMRYSAGPPANDPTGLPEAEGHDCR